MALGKSHAFNGNYFVNLVGKYARIVEDDNSSQRMANQPHWEIADDIQQDRQVKDVLGHAVHGTRRPGAVAMTAQVQSINVIVLPQGTRYPIPTAGVIQAAVH